VYLYRVQQCAFARLEPGSAKVLRRVLKGRWRSNAPLLPDITATHILSWQARKEHQEGYH